MSSVTVVLRVLILATRHLQGVREEQRKGIIAPICIKLPEAKNIERSSISIADQKIAHLSGQTTLRLSI